MRFYSVKDRRTVEVPTDRVKAVKYERTTKSGKKQVRYALKAEYNGRKLTKFVDEATYKRYARKEEVPDEVLSHPEHSSLERPRKQEHLTWRLIRKKRPRLPKGTPGYKVAALAGSITDADAEQMLRIIEEGCEQIDESQW